MGAIVEQPSWEAPEYLKDYTALSQHIRAQFEDYTSQDKGKFFARFVQMLVPQTDGGSSFNSPQFSEKESHDDGIDLHCKSLSGDGQLYIQAKLWIDRAETIDSIFSKFQAFSPNLSQDSRTGQLRLSFEDEKPEFMIVTLSRLDGIMKQYKKRNFASRAFFDQLESEERCHIVDGDDVLAILQAAYRKLHEVPSDIQLNLETEVINKGGVYFGIISSIELRRLHEQFGDALFFENIRDFQGRGSKKEGRNSVNNEIIRTVANEPERMLERNNGIVFRASKVSFGSTRNQLLLGAGSVINGCQTTMCIVDYSQDICFVPVKVVETQMSWDVAKSANYQNPVDVIDLDLARNLRPQLAKRAAAHAGWQIDDAKPSSAFQIIDRVYQHKIAYSETRLLYIGFFSRTPNNVFASNYTELMQDLIRRFYEADPMGESVLEILFSLQDAAQSGLQEAQKTFQNKDYATIYERLYSDESLSYRCFIAILAACGLVGVDISDRSSDGSAEFQRTQTFLESLKSGLSLRRERFLRYYRHAVKLWMQETMRDNSDETRQSMHTFSKRSPFGTLYRKLCIEADDDDVLRNS